VHGGQAGPDQGGHRNLVEGVSDAVLNPFVSAGVGGSTLDRSGQMLAAPTVILPLGDNVWEWDEVSAGGVQVSKWSGVVSTTSAMARLSSIVQ
jgi:hypothetical protein